MPIKIETDEEYHGGEGVSKSRLFKLYKKSPFHARYGTNENKPQFAIGKAAHIAILEPERLETSVMRGPADRRGNNWKAAMDEATHFGKILLTEGDFVQAMLIRDLANTIPELDMLRSDPDHITETSAYHHDEEFDVLTKTRVDFYSPAFKGILDIKNMADGSPEGFRRDVAMFGYHMQDAMYSDVWAKGSGFEVDVFFFLVFEKCEPPTFKFYELTPSAKAEGHEIYRAALKKWAECEKSGYWPSYGDGVQKLNLRKYDYKMTVPPADLAAEEQEDETEDEEDGE